MTQREEVMMEGAIEIVNFMDVPESLRQETRLWRNSPSVKPFFRIQNIDAETHTRWLASLMCESPCTIAFIVKCGSVPVGVTYFHSLDYEARTGDWGIYLHREEFRGRGVGSEVLSRMIDYARDVLNLRMLYLDVKEDNLRAQHVYERHGFAATGARKGMFLRYACKLHSA